MGRTGSVEANPCPNLAVLERLTTAVPFEMSGRIAFTRRYLPEDRMVELYTKQVGRVVSSGLRWALTGWRC